jgi:CheY-like chemotaxis protein
MHTILIVDHVASQRELLRAWLKDDYTAYTAADVATGLALAAQTEPDLMFLALPLPDCDGGEVGPAG